MKTKRRKILEGFPQKFFKSWKSSGKKDEKQQLRGLKIGFYPSKKNDKNKNTVIRFW